MKKSCLLLGTVAIVVAIGVIVFSIVYQIKNPSKSKVLSKKFGFDITEEIKITYFDSHDGGTKAALLLNNDQYDVFLSNMTQVGFSKNINFERIPKDVVEISPDVPINYLPYLHNCDWMPIYDISEEYIYMGVDDKTRKRIHSYVCVTDEINGFRRIYLRTNY